MDKLSSIQKLLGSRLQENVPLAPFTTFKIGGPADLFFEARTADELAAAIIAAKKDGMPVWVMGGGSNVLIGDKGIRGLVIRNLAGNIAVKGMQSRQINGVVQKIVYVEAESGVAMNKLVRYTVDEGLAGLHMHLGLPGTVGGAVYMNSKWTRPEGAVGDVVHRVRIIDTHGNDVTVGQSYFRFAYDYSVLQKTGEYVISVVFALTSDTKEHLWQTANESIAYRRATQPQGILSAGCTFRNISQAQAFTVNTPGHTTSAGFLIDHAGLKGARIGDAQISPVHANFIVNTGKATAADVVQLVELARKTVNEKFGVVLEEEIQRVGEF